MIRYTALDPEYLRVLINGKKIYCETELAIGQHLTVMAIDNPVSFAKEPFKHKYITAPRLLKLKGRSVLVEFECDGVRGNVHKMCVDDVNVENNEPDDFDYYVFTLK